MNDLLKFHCDFGSGTTCTVVLDMVKYRSDPKNIRPKTEWVGLRTEEMFPTYLAWIHTVNHRISEAIQGNHMYIIQTWFDPPHWQYWLYKPNGEKKLIAEADGKFHPSLVGR